MFPVPGAYGPHLITVWSCGTGGCLTVLSQVNGELRVTLDLWSKWGPEIVDIDSDGVDEIAVSEDPFLVNGFTGEVEVVPQTADVYKWNGTSFVRVWTGPWSERLTALKATPESK
jgi:hypothetical protein